MFTIYVDNLLMYDDTSPLESLKVVSPKLSLSQNSAGSFTMIVPPTNVGYDYLERLTSRIRIYKDTQEDPYWEGRILSETTDFWKCKNVTCEGILGVLNDSIQEPYHYQNATASSFLGAILSKHNDQVEDWKKIFLGNVEPQLTYAHRYTNFESTLECINEKLIKNEGGYIQIRYEEGVKYLDYLITYPSENSQKIEFGKNLLDFSKSFNSEDFCTVLVPRGAELDEGPYEALTPYVDVSSVNDGSIYVYLTNDDFDEPPETLPIDEFGWIAAVHDWEDVYYPSNLLSRAKDYLKNVQFDKMQLEVSALDLRYSGFNYDEIKLNDTVRVLSVPHGLNRLFPVTKLDIPLDQPENTKFTLGSTVKVSLTHRDVENTIAIKNEIASLPTEQKIVNRAKAEAATIVDSAITGYVTIVHNPITGAEEFIVSSLPDYMDDEATYWRWTHGGLAFYPHGHNTIPEDVTVAITSTGQISADLITTGRLIADVLQLGELQDHPDEAPPGQNFYLNLKTGELRIGQLNMALDKLNNIGGTNLIINTLDTEGVTGVNKIAKLYGQLHDTYINNYTIAYASHGVRLIKGSSTKRLLFSFGEGDPTSEYASMNGLYPGSTYTVSFNFKARVLNTQNEARWRLAVASFDRNNSSTIQEIWTHEIQNGVEESFRVVSTFTIPNNAVSCCLQMGVRYSDNTSPEASDYDATDFYEFVNMKLEAGEVSTAWSPAPQDYEQKISDGDNSTWTAFNEAMGSYINKTDASITSIVADVQTLNGDKTVDGSIAKMIYTSEEQTAEKYSIAIGEAVSHANDVVGKVEARFDFTTEGLEISGTEKSTPGSKLKLASNRVSLYQNNSERLWLDPNGANADAFNANNFIKIGTSSTGKYLWEAYSGGFRLRKE